VAPCIATCDLEATFELPFSPVIACVTLEDGLMTGILTSSDSDSDSSEEDSLLLDSAFF
jgi:hypothetical protein